MRRSIRPSWLLLLAIPLLAPATALSQTELRSVRLPDVRMRDIGILADSASGLYYAVSSAGRNVQAYTSRDLVTWEGPHIVFRTPPALWGDSVNIRSIWAPEMHRYRGKYYLFLTFDTDYRFPEQWRNWLPRVMRGSQVLVADSPLGPFRPFANRPTLPPDMMTLDATLWEEEGVPYMVFAHEWVQIKDGTIEMVRLTDDLSAIVGDPALLFSGSEGPWATRQRWGSYVTDAPWLHRSRNGKLLMIWSSFGAGGYMVGIAESTSGTLKGPWVQQREPLFAEGGGHPMLFRRFDGQLMMVLHQPNDGGRERARLFEIDDLGDTLRIRAPFPAPGR